MAKPDLPVLWNSPIYIIDGIQNFYAKNTHTQPLASPSPKTLKFISKFNRTVREANIADTKKYMYQRANLYGGKPKPNSQRLLNREPFSPKPSQLFSIGKNFVYQSYWDKCITTMLGVENLGGYEGDLGYYNYLDLERENKMRKINRRFSKKVEAIVGSDCTGITRHVLPRKFEGVLETILGVLIKVNFWSGGEFL